MRYISTYTRKKIISKCQLNPSLRFGCLCVLHCSIGYCVKSITVDDNLCIKLLSYCFHFIWKKSQPYSFEEMEYLEEDYKYIDAKHSNFENFESALCALYGICEYNFKYIKFKIYLPAEVLISFKIIEKSSYLKKKKKKKQEKQHSNLTQPTSRTLKCSFNLRTSLICVIEKKKSAWHLIVQISIYQYTKLAKWSNFKE